MTANFRILFVFMLSLLTIGESYSQGTAPGYLGRRLQIGLNLAVSPVMGASEAVRNYAGTRSGLYDGTPYFRTRQEVEAHMATSRKSSFGVHFATLRTGYFTNAFSFAPNFIYTFGQMKFRGVGLSYRVFPFLKRGNISPIGPFTQFQYTLYRGTLSDPQSSTSLPTQAVFEGIFGMYFGYAGVLSNRLLFNWGLEVNFPLLNNFLSPVTASVNDVGDRGALATALATHTLLNFRFSLSGLIF